MLLSHLNLLIYTLFNFVEYMLYEIVIIVGILTFMSRINFVLSLVEHGKSFITLGQVRCFVDSILFKV